MTADTDLYAAKCFWPGVTERRIQRAAACASARADARGTPPAPRYTGSIVFSDDEVVLCLFRAASSTAVRHEADRAGFPCERVMAATWLPARSDAQPQKLNPCPPSV